MDPRASTDADGDPITYTFDWDRDGESHTDTDTTTHTGDTVDYSAVSYDDEWTCEVTPDDGDDEGSSASASSLRKYVRSGMRSDIALRRTAVFRKLQPIPA